MSTSYKVLRKDGIVILNYDKAACYSNMFSGAIPRDAATIVSWFLDSETPYTREQIEAWVKAMNDDFDMPVELLPYTNKHEVSLDLSKYDDNKTKVLSALTTVRYLWEMGQNRVPGIYFELVEKYPDEDKITLLLHAHNLIMYYPWKGVPDTHDPNTGYNYAQYHGNSGHMLRGPNMQTMLTKEEVNKRLIIHKYPIYNSSYKQINPVWSGNTVPPYIPDEDQYFNYLKQMV